MSGNFLRGWIWSNASQKRRNFVNAPQISWKVFNPFSICIVKAASSPLVNYSRFTKDSQNKSEKKFFISPCEGRRWVNVGWWRFVLVLQKCWKLKNKNPWHWKAKSFHEIASKTAFNFSFWWENKKNFVKDLPSALVYRIVGNRPSCKPFGEDCCRQRELSHYVGGWDDASAKITFTLDRLNGFFSSTPTHSRRGKRKDFHYSYHL